MGPVHPLQVASEKRLNPMLRPVDPRLFQDSVGEGFISSGLASRGDLRSRIDAELCPPIRQDPSTLRLPAGKECLRRNRWSLPFPGDIPSRNSISFNKATTKSFVRFREVEKMKLQ